MFLSKVSWLMWVIWQSRNAVIFREIHDEPAEVIGRAAILQNEFERTRRNARHLTSSSMPHIPNTTSSVWQPPPVNVFKINFDGAFQEQTTTGIGAMVVRNHVGTVINSAALRYSNVTAPTVIEAMALRDAINLAKRLQLPKVIFEGDAKVIIDAMTMNSAVDFNCDIIVQDWKVLAESLMPHSFQFVKRANNWVAHLLAKKALRDHSLCCNNLAQIMLLESRLM